MNVWDTGTFTCEIEVGMEEQTTVSHFLQVLGTLFNYLKMAIQNQYQHSFDKWGAFKLKLMVHTLEHY